MELLGTIIRLQVQRSTLKPGERPCRWYDPAPLLAVPALAVEPSGVFGLTDSGERVVAVHNVEHPKSQNSGGVNDISVGFTAHYDAMRARFGPHLGDGLAGENVIVQNDRIVGEDEVASGIVIETADGEQVSLEAVVFAEPCVEFSRFALRRPPDAGSDATVAETLRFLRHGTRGYYPSYTGPPRAIRLGDRVYRR